MDIKKFLIEHNHISILSSVWDWKDAIKQCCKPLLSKQMIEKIYIEAIIENTKVNGPYYVILPHVAMPHARPENGVCQNCVSLLSVKQGVKFHSNNDPVRLVFVVAAVSADYFSETMLPSISELLQNQSLVDQLIEARSSGEIKNILQNNTSTELVQHNTSNNLQAGKKNLYIITVCGVGMGSSLILRMTVEAILKEHGISAKVEHTDVSSVSGMKADLIITGEELAKTLRGKSATPIAIVTNYVDKEEVAQVLRSQLIIC